jgi:serine/threonine-protein kinase
MSSLALGIQPGDLVDGKYRLGEILGQGGMGVVISAMHEQLDQQVALKVLLPEAVRPEIVQRFLREARAAVKIHSEHVARVFDVGTLPSGVPYMVMEHLQGQDLSVVLKQRGPLPAEDAVGFLLEACEAIAEAHALGMVHRDLKPANLFLARRPSGQPVIKVLDFGISKIASGGADGALTSTQGVMGSPLYMSPEQMVAAKNVDARSDIWSLGVVLYELLTVALPFDGDTMPAVVAAILSLSPRALAELRPDISPGLQLAIARCLEKEPALRFQNLTELVRALAPFGPARGAISVERVEHLLGDARPSATEQRVRPPGPAPAMSVTYPPIATPTPGTVPRRVWILPGLILVGVAGILATLAFHARHAPAAVAVTPAPVLLPSSLPPLPPPTAALSAPVATGTASPPPRPAPSVSAALPEGSAVPPVPPAPHAPSPHVHSGSSAAPTPSATPAPASAANGCHTESFYDSAGLKHFKQVCP